MVRKFGIWVLLCVFLIPVSVSADDDFSNIVIFGDSLSDSGNMYSLTGGAIPPDPPYYSGRSSNGILWHEYLLNRLNLQEGISLNHAWVGAKSGRDNVFDYGDVGFPGFHDAIDHFVASLGAGGVGADEDALYIVWIGANDFLSLAGDPAQAIGEAVANTLSGLFRLRDAGAKHFMLINMPDLGLTPIARSTGLSTELSSLSQAFNMALQAEVQQLDMNILQVDVYAILRKATEMPQRYRLKNVTDSCYTEKLVCTEPDVIQSCQIEKQVCTEPDTYMYWDHVHPTTRGHEILAKSFRHCLKTHRACFRDKKDKEKRNYGSRGVDSLCSCSMN